MIAWDTHAGPGLHQGGPQEWIDLALNIQESDLFVAIFEGKLGTPYKQYASGTVYEIDSAISSFKERQSPQVWVCVPSSNESTESRYKLSSELGDFIAKLSSGTDAD